MKKIALLLPIVLTVFAVSACQPTPDKVVVQGKSLDKMIESATKEQPQTSGSPQGGTISDKIGAQPTYEKELADAKGKVKIHVNAKVIIPNAEKVSVQRVERAEISQEAVDVVRQQLVRGELFSAEDYMPTKEELQEKILTIEASIAKGGSNNPKAKLGGLEGQKAQLEELKKQLETAPDTHIKKPLSGKLESYDDGTYSGGNKLLGYAQSEQGGYESFTVYNDEYSAVYFLSYNSEKNAFSDNMGYFSSKESIEAAEAQGFNASPSSAEIAAIPDIKLTKEEAQQKAETLISALGIDDLTCYSAEKVYGGSYEQTADFENYLNPRKCVWFLRYVRKVNEIPITYTAWDCMKVEKDAQSAPWSYEDMTFAIDDSGIVGLRWSSPYKFTGVVTESSNLLPFKDVTDVFDTMSLVVNAWDGLAEGNPRLTGIDIKVDEVRFGLTRITEQNKRDSGLLVPVWDFFGTMTYISEVDGQIQKMDDGPIPILTVNAIDGSVINRSLGY